MGTIQYREMYLPRVIVIENHKGGTGKSTTTVTLATAAALDLNLNARILVIDWTRKVHWVITLFIPLAMIVFI